MIKRWNPSTTGETPVPPSSAQLIIDLGGEWELTSTKEADVIPATVPGCVHLDLLAAGRIPDPFWRDNEKLAQWVSDREWIYSREFEIAAELLQHENVVLRCEGLDTLATIFVNGQQLAHTTNMFRSWEFDVKPLLHVGVNRIEVRFQAALPHTRELQKKRYLHAWLSREEGVNYLRKEACNYGWDWGPKLVTCGIWQPISVIGWSTARISDVHATQQHETDGSVSLRIAVLLKGSVDVGGPLQISIEVKLDAAYVASAKLKVRGSQAIADIRIPDPQHWWPNGIGEQPLYTIRVQLMSGHTAQLDTWQRRIGLRQLRLERHDDPAGQSFFFSCNGQPFFAKGANWIPADVFATRVRDDDYRDLLRSTADANMNMLRVWGGGIYEQEIFYDLCDELGICVWQDFMFACATYPTFDCEWMRNVRMEAEQQVRRLRHHACLALWCGNNELEQGLLGPMWTVHQMPWRDASRVFDQLLPGVVEAHDPERDYWPGSPHSPVGRRRDCNSPNSGDAHLWSVWHAGEPFEWYRTSRHRFCSEFGFQSFPEPKTIAAFALPEDQNISSYVMDFHQRSWVGNGAIQTYMLAWFRQPRDFDTFVWVSQIVQALAMKYAVEHWRRQMPHTMGALYWQLNDTWPGPSWSSIDYYHRWKALHYVAKRFFAPVMTSLVEKQAERSVEVWLTSDLREAKPGKLKVTITNCAGDVLHEQEQQVEIAANRSALCTTVHVPSVVAGELEWGKTTSVPQLTAGGVPVDTSIGPRDLIVWAEVQVDGEVVARNTATFAKPKHLELREPEIVVEWLDQQTVRLSAKAVALWVWLESTEADLRFSDNFFDLRPGAPVVVSVRTHSSNELVGRPELRVQSLLSTSP